MARINENQKQLFKSFEMRVEDKIERLLKKQRDEKADTYIQKIHKDAMAYDQRALQTREVIEAMEDAGKGDKPETDIEAGVKNMLQLIKGVVTRLLSTVGLAEPSPWFRQSDYDVKQSLIKTVQRDTKRANILRHNARSSAETEMKQENWKPDMKRPELQIEFKKLNDAKKIMVHFGDFKPEAQRQVQDALNQGYVGKAIASMLKAEDRDDLFTDRAKRELFGARVSAPVEAMAIQANGLEGKADLGAVVVDSAPDTANKQVKQEVVPKTPEPWKTQGF